MDETPVCVLNKIVGICTDGMVEYIVVLADSYKNKYSTVSRSK